MLFFLNNNDEYFSFDIRTAYWSYGNTQQACTLYHSSKYFDWYLQKLRYQCIECNYKRSDQRLLNNISKFMDFNICLINNYSNLLLRALISDFSANPCSQLITITYVSKCSCNTCLIILLNIVRKIDSQRTKWHPNWLTEEQKKVFWKCD